jgi:hypothetical protein
MVYPELSWASVTTVDPKLGLQAPAVAAACAEDKHWTMYARVVAPPSDAAFAVMVMVMVMVMVIAVGLSRVAETSVGAP